VGLSFFACGALFLAIFGQRYTLTCARPEPSQLTCERAGTWLGLISTGKRPVAGLSGAWVDESCDEDGCTYRVELDSTEGPVGLTGYYTSGYDDKAATAAEINGWLQQGGDTLVVAEDSGILGVLLPAVFMLLGIGMAAAWGVSLLRLLLFR
jgi:hypothetical protein